MTMTDDRLTTLEESVDELKLLADETVKLAKANEHNNEVIAKRLGRVERDVAGLRTDTDIIRGDVNILRDGQRELQRDVTSLKSHVTTIELTQAEHTSALREQSDQLKEILARLDARGGNAS